VRIRPNMKVAVRRGDAFYEGTVDRTETLSGERYVFGRWKVFGGDLPEKFCVRLGDVRPWTTPEVYE
jgi:hypothetical protein